MNRLFQLSEFTRYRWRALGSHSIHSPFVFHLFNTVIQDRSIFYAFEPIEKARKRAFTNNTDLKITDFGAGSQVSSEKVRKVSEIARSASLSPHFARILFKLIDQFQPEKIIELGTGLGFTTAYFASASRHSTIYTLEGCPGIAQQSRSLFNELKLDNINLIEGDFGRTFSSALTELTWVDFAFVDGNHRLKPTIEYFNMLMEKVRNNSVLVFDDIHWSPEMKEAWKLIFADPRITLSIDLSE